MKLTSAGRSTVALAALLWAAAFASASPAAALAAAALTLALAFALASLRRPKLTLERVVSRHRAVEEEILVETLTLSCRSAGRYRVEATETATDGFVPLDPPTLEGWVSRGGTLTKEVRWRAQTWGRKGVGPLRVTLRDPLGLLQVQWDEGDEVEVRVLPRAKPLGRFKPTAKNPEPGLGVHSVSKPGDGMEFFALRDYQTGDNVRRINWKASARSSKTVVNQVTRDSYARCVVFLDLREKEGLGAPLRAPIVQNGRIAAAILNHHDRMKDHLTLIAVTSRADRVSTMTNPRTSDLLNDLAGLRAQGSSSLMDAVRQSLRYVKPRSPVYVVTSGVLDPELHEALRLLLALNANPTLLSPRVAAEDVDAEHRDLVLRTREASLAAARSLGIRVADCPDDTPLEVVLAGV